MIEPGRLDHFGRDVTPKICDLFSNVTEKGIAGPPAQEHDGVDGDMVEMHGHGSGGAAGMQTYFIRSNSQALAVDGFYVGPEKLESNGAGHVPNFPRCRLVGIDESFGSRLKGKQTADNGSGGFDGTKERVVCC